MQDTSANKTTFVDNCLLYSMGLILFVMLVVVFVQVVFRYVLNSSLSWTEEVARFLQVYLTFVGSVLAMKIGAHISLGDSLTKRLPKIGRIAIFLITNIAIGAFLATMFVHGMRILQVVRFQSSASLEISMAYIYAVIPLSAALSLAFLIYNMYRRRGSI